MAGGSEQWPAGERPGCFPEKPYLRDTRRPPGPQARRRLTYRIRFIVKGLTQEENGTLQPVTSTVVAPCPLTWGILSLNKTSGSGA